MNKETKKIGINYIYNLSFQIFSIIVPLITTPYISRVLGAEMIGIYSYTLSISTYFIVAGSLGFPLYGQREIAYRSNNVVERSKLFFQIIIGQLILLSTSLILYILFVVFIANDNKSIFYAQAIGIIGGVLATSWFYIGIEEFRVTAIKNFIVKIISIIGLFVFVKKPSDIIIYTCIMGGSNVIGNLIILVDIKKYVDFKYLHISLKDAFKHIKPAFILGIPYYITSIYSIIDKTMLGALGSGYAEVGYYEQSQKILNLAVAIVTSLGTVLMPRLANNFGEKDYDSLRKYLDNGINITSLLGAPIMFGLIAISSSLVPWFFGDNYNKVIILICVFSPLAFIMGINNLLGSQLLVVVKKEKILTIIILFSTLLNCTLNAILIPNKDSIGAAMATIISELVKMIVLILYSYKYLNIGISFYCIRYILLSSIMFVAILLMKKTILFAPIFINTLGLILIGGIVYFFILFLTRDKYIQIFIKTIVKK